MLVEKPYQSVPTIECHEGILAIPLDKFSVFSPHPYMAAGADYGESSPYFLRTEVIEKLLAARGFLQEIAPNWQLKIFDAYRPVSVQKYMVDYTFKTLLAAHGLDIIDITPDIELDLWQQVYQIWAIPSEDPANAPPHSTGGAIDLTLEDDRGETVDMGSDIDAMVPATEPDYFGRSTDAAEIQYHRHRELLKEVMEKAGFERHPGEWWHFSYGDRLWVWQRQQKGDLSATTAIYGRI
jgi:zinc D-Ala-D-Ala dipeptidase